MKRRRKNPRVNPRQRLPPDAFLLIDENVRDDAGRYQFTLGIAGEDADGIWQLTPLGYIQAFDFRAGDGDIGADIQVIYGRPTTLFPVMYSGAKRGYGPAVYDAVSIYARASDLGPLGYFPDQQSESARRIWAKNKEPQRGLFGDRVVGWAPLTKTEFRDRYGIAYGRLLANAEALDGWEKAEARRVGWRLYASQ